MSGIEIESIDEKPSDDASENTEDSKGETEDPVDEQDDADSNDGEHVPTNREVNMAISGVLTLHYELRDVSLVVDGDAALRLITMFETQSDEQWRDLVDPLWSSAASGWLSLNLAEPMAVSYLPFPRRFGRTTIDPH